MSKLMKGGVDCPPYKIEIDGECVFCRRSSPKTCVQKGPSFKPQIASCRTQVPQKTRWFG